MSLNVGSVYIDFEIKDNKTITTLKQIETSILKTGDNIKNFTNNSNNNLNLLSQSFQKIKNETDSLRNNINTLMAAFKGIIIGVVANQFAQLGLNLEKTEVSFSTMLGSMQKAKTLLSELNQFANFTPFSNEEIIKSSQILLSFGVNIKDIMENLKILGDISSGTGQRINELSTIFGQVFVAGKLQAGEMNQFLERGIPILDALSKYFGTTKENIREMIIESKINFEDFKNSLKLLTEEGGLFANSMQKQSETLSGKLSTLSGSFQDLLSKISYLLLQGLEPFLDILIPIISYINELITNLRNWFENLSEGDQKLIKIIIAITGFTTAILILIPILQNTLIPIFLSLINNIIPSLISSFTTLNAFLGPIGWIILGLISVISILIIKFNDWKNVIQPLTNIIKEIFSLIKNNDIFQMFINTISNLFKIFSNDKTKKIEETSSKLSTLTIIIRSLIAVISSLIIFLITGYQTLFNFAKIILNSYKLVFDAIIIIINKIKNNNISLTEELEKIWENYKNSTIENFSNINDTIKKNALAVKETFEEIFKEPSEINIDTEKAEKDLDKIKSKTNELIKENKEIIINFNFIGGKDLFTSAISDILNNLKTSFESLSKSLDTSFQKIGSIGISFLGKYSDFANGILKTFSEIIIASQTLINVIQQKQKIVSDWISFFYNKQIQNLENFQSEQNKILDKELENYNNYLNELRNIYKSHLNELKLMSNEDYQNRKRLLEIELKEKKMQDREEFERRRDFLLMNSQDSLEYYTNLEILEEDFRRLSEEREREFQEKLKNLQEEIRNEKLQKEIELNQNLLLEKGIFNQEQWNLMSDEQKRTAFLNYLKEQEALKQEEINNKKLENERMVNNEKKRLEKERMLIEYINQLNQFNINKMLQILQLRIQMITSIAQIWAGLLSGFAMVPFGLGIPIAIGLATALSAMIAGMFTQAIGIVSAIPPPPPPVGLQSGGILDSGLPTNKDHIPALLSNGEAVIDKGRTEKLFNAIDNNFNNQKNIIINNSIQIEGIIDEKLIQIVSEKINDKIKSSII